MGETRFPEVEEFHAAWQRPKSRNGPKASFLAALMCLALYVYCRPTVAIRNHQDRLITYPGEQIGWEPCGDIEGHRVECGAIDVPMDQFSKNNSGNKTFNIPLIRMRGHNATRNLLVNPGGPGGSGISFLYAAGKMLNAIVGEQFHILSFDPRGVNSSRPLALCYPDNEARTTLSKVHDKDVITDSAEIYAWAHNFVQACFETTGEHGKYLNTPQAAADMNSILDSIGQENMFYWGFSYGTTLGQTYASLYPDRSERVIIDGVSNQFKWFGVGNNSESLEDTERILYGFFDGCFKAKVNCPLANLADTADKLQGLVFALSDRLKEDPISVYINSTTYGTFDHMNLWRNAIFPAMYKPFAWPALADRLAKLLQGNATEAFLAYPGNTFRSTDDTNSFVQLNDGLSGAKYWPQERHEFLDEILLFFSDSIFAPLDERGFYERQQWLIPRTHSFTPPQSVQTLHPLLILTTTYDPVCPMVSAQSARDTFEGSRIIEVKGYGHCSVAMPSTCAARHVRGFLHHGKLPETDSQCEPDGPYFPSPDEQTKVARQMGFNSEELRIHEAQSALAQDMNWPVPHFF